MGAQYKIIWERILRVFAIFENMLGARNIVWGKYFFFELGAENNNKCGLRPHFKFGAIQKIKSKKKIIFRE